MVGTWANVRNWDFNLLTALSSVIVVDSGGLLLATVLLNRLQHAEDMQYIRGYGRAWASGLAVHPLPVLFVAYCMPDHALYMHLQRIERQINSHKSTCFCLFVITHTLTQYQLVDISQVMRHSAV